MSGLPPGNYVYRVSGLVAKNVDFTIKSTQGRLRTRTPRQCECKSARASGAGGAGAYIKCGLRYGRDG
jgi:hypothetical protein